MKKRFLLLFFAVCLGCTFSSSHVWAQQPATPDGVTAHIVVTAEPRHGANAPVIQKEDVMVYQGHDRDSVVDWTPLKGDKAGIELFILIDDESGLNLGSHLEDIKDFINAQPSTTKIGIAYMQNGVAQVVQSPTNDHA